MRCVVFLISMLLLGSHQGDRDAKDQNIFRGFSSAARALCPLPSLDPGFPGYGQMQWTLMRPRRNQGARTAILSRNVGKGNDLLSITMLGKVRGCSLGFSHPAICATQNRPPASYPSAARCWRVLLGLIGRMWD